MIPDKLRQTLTVLVLAAAFAPAAAFAADADSSKSGMAGHDMKGGKGGGSSIEMHQQMMQGMKEMQSMKPTGDFDRDFATMMRHHHQQGVRMAEQELKNGKDKKMRDMAQKIIDSQKKEIAEFDEWLKANPSKTGGTK
ncbi:MAG TPA: DUF305 domain-containing protein [Burkholderiales bacterium]|nr:DUF305 domain-containing protein [Burkholderiales bacterium]